MEKRAVRDSAEHAGAKEVHLIAEPMAAAIGMPMAGVVCGVHDDQRLREAGAEVVLEYAAHLPVWLAHGGRTVPG